MSVVYLQKADFSAPECLSSLLRRGFDGVPNGIYKTVFSAGLRSTIAVLSTRFDMASKGGRVLNGPQLVSVIQALRTTPPR